MNLYLQLFLIAGSVLFEIFVLFLVSKNKLQVKYSIVWISIGAMCIILSIFPAIVENLADLLHIVEKVNVLYLIGIFVLLVICFLYNIILSKQSKYIKTLIQEVSLLKQKVSKYEK